MAWTGPAGSPWVTGYVVLASDLVTYLDNNLLETAPAKVTTAGDIVYATAANAIARLGIGTFGQVLSVNSGATAPEWTNKVLLGGNTNARMTIGISIDQGANDDEIFALMSTDVGHAFTDITDTNTYGAVQKQDAGNGGLYIAGYTEATIGFVVSPRVTTEDGTKSAAGRAAFEVNAYLLNGNSVQNPGANTNLFAVAAGTTTRFIVDVDGDTWQGGSAVVDTAVFIGDTANAKMTIGLTINQGAADNEAVALKSSDVAHGGTDETETDTWGRIQKSEATSGGMRISGYKDGDGSAGLALRLDGALGENVSTVKGTGGRSIVEIVTAQISGTALANVVANGNVFSVTARRGGTDETVFIVDEDGDVHVDAGGAAGTANPTAAHADGIIGWNFYDEYNDWEMARALRASLTPAGHWAHEKYAGLVTKYKSILSGAGLVTYNDDGHHFLALKKMALFNLDMGFQLGEMAMAHESRIAELERENLALHGQIEQIQHALGG